MINFRLLISVCICIVTLFIDDSSPIANNLDIMLKNEYGEGYGTDWIYFPDEDGTLHYIDLKVSEDEMIGARTVTDDDVELRLYKNATTYILLNYHGRAVNESDQDTVNNLLGSNIPLKIITHGWQSSADNEGVINITKAYLLKENVIVITVDWSPIANNFIYQRAAQYTSNVGATVAKFLDALYMKYDVTGDQLHLIGHSLGAHVMGSAGVKTNSPVYRITGLDPARPFYEFPATYESLNASDAEIVDVIHTCAGLLGFQRSIGTVDFYPNQGTAPQPGCGEIIKIMTACSHTISKYYFLESILNPEIYPAYECSSWQDFLDHKCNHSGYMGEGISLNMTGIYYLTTNGTELSSYHYVKANK